MLHQSHSSVALWLFHTTITALLKFTYPNGFDQQVTILTCDLFACNQYVSTQILGVSELPILYYLVQMDHVFHIFCSCSCSKMKLWGLWCMPGRKPMNHELRLLEGRKLLVSCWPLLRTLLSAGGTNFKNLLNRFDTAFAEEPKAQDVGVCKAITQAEVTKAIKKLSLQVGHS